MCHTIDKYVLHVVVIVYLQDQKCLEVSSKGSFLCGDIDSSVNLTISQTNKAAHHHHRFPLTTFELCRLTPTNLQKVYICKWDKYNDIYSSK